ncbi:hypothetical protein IID21_01650 [Patescibacteria group bacterium]|nr:hypothetical protein [Patescibacteria group bacterium]
MSEQHSANVTPTRLEKVKTKVEHRVNPTVRKLTEEFHSILETRQQFDIHNLPKVLQLTVGDREYTSIRRIDGNRIVKVEHPAEDNDPFNHVIEYRVDASLLDEGMVGVIVTPEHFSAQPKDRELIEFLKTQGDFDDHEGWGTMLKTAILKGRPFKLVEWKLGTPLLGVVKRQGGELYVPSRIYFSKETEAKLPSLLGIAKKITPDGQGMITISDNYGWWSRDELQVQRDLDEKFATFYVMVEGSSEQEKKEAPGSAKKLEPKLSEVTS